MEIFLFFKYLIFKYDFNNFNLVACYEIRKKYRLKNSWISDLVEDD